MSSPAKDLDENQAATLAAGAGQVLSETLASAKADLAEYIGDDNNFEKLFNVLKMGGYEPLAKYESFPAAGKEREELRTTLTSEPEKVVEALDSINQTFDQKKEEGGLKEWVMGLYEKSPTAFAIGAQFLGRALGLDPTLVQIGLQMLEEFTNEKNGKGAPQDKAADGPEEPVKGGEARTAGKQQSVLADNTFQFQPPPGFKGEIKIVVAGDEQPVPQAAAIPEATRQAVVANANNTGVAQEAPVHTVV